jgi:hypothetical protein
VDSDLFRRCYIRVYKPSGNISGDEYCNFDSHRSKIIRIEILVFVMFIDPYNVSTIQIHRPFCCYHMVDLFNFPSILYSFVNDLRFDKKRKIGNF